MSKIAKVKYASFALVVGPLLEPYGFWGSIVMYKVFMLVNFLYFLTYNRYTIPKFYIPFLVYIFTVPVFLSLFSDKCNILASYLTPLLFSVNLFFICYYVKKEYIIKYYKYLVLLCCFVFILQEISAIVLGVRFLGLIPFLKLTYDYVDMQSFIENMSMKDRSCSMFLEPSHFAQYIIPFLAIELGRLHETKRIISPIAIFLTLVLLFLKSGNGLLLCALLWFISILFSNIRKSKKIFILFPFITIVLFYGFNYIIHTEMGEQLLSRMDELDPDSGKMTSGIMRVFRGFWVFGDLSSIIQIFGGSFGAKDMLIEGSSYIWMFRDNERYINNH